MDERESDYLGLTFCTNLRYGPEYRTKFKKDRRSCLKSSVDEPDVTPEEIYQILCVCENNDPPTIIILIILVGILREQGIIKQKFTAAESLCVLLRYFV